MRDSCGVKHRLDELDFAGCAACAWRAYHRQRDEASEYAALLRRFVVEFGKVKDDSEDTPIVERFYADAANLLAKYS